MADSKHVSGLTVGPMLSEDTHDAIKETRERRKAVRDKATGRTTSASSEQTTEQTSDTQQQSEQQTQPGQ